MICTVQFAAVLYLGTKMEDLFMSNLNEAERTTVENEAPEVWVERFVSLLDTVLLRLLQDQTYHA